MTSPSTLVVLDTSVVVHLVRHNEVGERIDRDYGLTSRADRPLVSIVTVGEVMYLADYFGWGVEKKQVLRDLLSQLVVVDVGQGDIVSRYASLAAHARRNGLNIGDNDAWIAATAAAANACLLTADKDFDRIHPKFVNRIWIDPAGDK